jgi:hypothetical protein
MQVGRLAMSVRISSSAWIDSSVSLVRRLPSRRVVVCRSRQPRRVTMTTSPVSNQSIHQEIRAFNQSRNSDQQTAPPSQESPATVVTLGPMPPAFQPPATQPQGTMPPTFKPPVTKPPATQMHETMPPTFQPPETKPPAIQPRGTMPPTSKPPAAESHQTQQPRSGRHADITA